MSDDAIRRVIVDYTREAGLRNMEREIATICRKAARRFAEGKRIVAPIGAEKIAESLGPPKYFREIAASGNLPGVATGLAWTPAGGEILFIEATGMPGKGALALTGLLGESMKESATRRFLISRATRRYWAWIRRNFVIQMYIYTYQQAPSPRTALPREWLLPRR